jgi:hypothetical protein
LFNGRAKPVPVFFDALDLTVSARGVSVRVRRRGATHAKVPGTRAKDVCRHAKVLRFDAKAGKSDAKVSQL